MLYFKRKEQLLYGKYDLNKQLLEFCKRLNQFVSYYTFSNDSYISYALYGIYFNSDELFGNTIILHSPYRNFNPEKYGEYKIKDNIDNVGIANLDDIDLYSNSGEFDTLIRPYILNLYSEIQYNPVEIYHYSHFTHRFLEEYNTKHFGFLMNDFSKRRDKKLINIANSDSVQTNLHYINGQSDDAIDIKGFLDRGFIYESHNF